VGNKTVFPREPHAIPYPVLRLPWPLSPLLTDRMPWLHINYIFRTLNSFSAYQQRTSASESCF
jgi:hypothetical protein